MVAYLFINAALTMRSVRNYDESDSYLRNYSKQFKIHPHFQCASYVRTDSVVS